ncbi:ABC transporter ATP-binding protein (plasmid) [Haloferacaceae archaeon DSL9]
MSRELTRSETVPVDRDDERHETLVEVTDLKTYYGGEGMFSGQPVKAVDGVSFEIRRGETLGLVGESGCGKTTLGRTLIQLEQATDGEILFDGTDITTLRGRDLKNWRRNSQMVFQDPHSSLNDRMTVGEIVREPLDVHEWKTPRERRQRVRELLEVVGLQREHYFRYPHQFSGGQRQRIGIARALALEPEFIVLDEPTSALDVSVQAKVLNLLEDLQDEFGLTYLFIAHDLSVVRHICDRVAVMYLGNVLEVGPTEELFEDPANPYTHALLSAIPEPDPTADRDRIILQGTPPSPRDPPAGCPFSTRCPAKIKPEAYANMDDEVWEAITLLRVVLDERGRTDLTLRERLKELRGKGTRLEDAEAVREELFDGLDPTPEVEEHIEAVIQRMEAGDDEQALEYLNEQFASVCDTESPEHHRVSESGRTSFCHRHLPEYASPAEEL